MGKSVYEYVGDQWKKPDTTFQSPYKNRLIQWRDGENYLRVDQPLRINRARALGYKAKPGYVIVRTWVRKGALRKHRINKGRKPSARGINKITAGKNTQRMAEERTAKRYPNMQVLNSYWVGVDGYHHYYEVILVDPSHPCIMNDPKINWVSDAGNRKRVLRGKTSAGQRGRGLHKKGKGAEKVRPSIRANQNRGK